MYYKYILVHMCTYLYSIVSVHVRTCGVCVVGAACVVVVDGFVTARVVRLVKQVIRGHSATCSISGLQPVDIDQC